MIFMDDLVENPIKIMDDLGIFRGIPILGNLRWCFAWGISKSSIMGIILKWPDDDDLGYPHDKTDTSISHDGSMVLLYMVTWIPLIYPLSVSIFTSTMDPSWVSIKNLEVYPLNLAPNVGPKSTCLQ